METEKEFYKPKTKVFGERAMRIDRNEYNALATELVELLKNDFIDLRPVELLDDKNDSGDIDMVCLPKRTIDRLYFEKIPGLKLVDYKRSGHVHSLLVETEDGKMIHVDFIQSKNDADFERKSMYYSKGHLSSLIGMLARKLNFKYGTDGFFKRYRDKRGNWHDIPVSGSLRDGLKILGFEDGVYDGIRKSDDAVGFISSSPFFDSSYFDFDNLVRRDREQVKRSAWQDAVASRLVAANKSRAIEGPDELFKRHFPDAYAAYLSAAEKIEKETYRPGAVTGDQVMEAFGVKPGPIVGKILKFLGENYSQDQELTEDIIERVKNEVLGENIGK